MKTKNTRRPPATDTQSLHFNNIQAGTKVSFRVENDDQWNGDRVGILIFEKGEFKIKTKRSGILTINKGYDVYGSTIKPV